MNPISYRLSKRAIFHVRKDSVILVLSYPLKTLSVNGAWRHVLERLAGPSFVPLSELRPLPGGASTRKIAGFLDRLTLTGFIDRRGADSSIGTPLVSVIIPVRNRPLEIDACLSSLSRLEYPSERIEIIVVDDASEDHTPSVAEHHPVRLIRLKRRQQAAFCRNIGARQARGEILAFIDSDCRADPQWLKQLMPAFADPSLAAVGGLVDTWHSRRRLELYEKAKSSLVVSSIARRTGPDNPFFYVPACNFLIRREVFLNVKGFDRRLTVGEDVDLCWRLQEQRYELEYRPEGAVYHKHRSRPPAFCMRRFDYGTSEPLLQKLHPSKEKVFVAPPGAAGFWLSLGLWIMTGWVVFGGTMCLAPVLDSLMKTFKYRRLPVGSRMIALATLRSYAAFAHNLCSFVSRYYLIAGVIAAPFAPGVAATMAVMHLSSCIVEYAVKRPWLGLHWFTVYYTLEQLSYQAGVWWGCLRHRTLEPLFPKIVFGRRKMMPSGRLQ